MKPSEAGAIIVAAGKGQRMGGMDKVFTPLGGRPLLAHTVTAFESCPAIHQIVIVLSPQNLERGRRLVAEEGWSKVVALCPGGERRQDSVAEGLKRLPPCPWVVIHDGARPLVTPELIERGLVAALETGAAVAATPVTDTIKVVSPQGLVQETPPRHYLWAVQTPQVFSYDIITAAHQAVAEEATDDAALVERLGYKVKVFMGSYDNIKITTPEDLFLAQALLEKRR